MFRKFLLINLLLSGCVVTHVFGAEPPKSPSDAEIEAFLKKGYESFEKEVEKQRKVFASQNDDGLLSREQTQALGNEIILQMSLLNEKMKMDGLDQELKSFEKLLKDRPFSLLTTHEMLSNASMLNAAFSSSDNYRDRFQAIFMKVTRHAERIAFTADSHIAGQALRLAKR